MGAGLLDASCSQRISRGDSRAWSAACQQPPASPRSGAAQGDALPAGWAQLLRGGERAGVLSSLHRAGRRMLRAALGLAWEAERVPRRHHSGDGTWGLAASPQEAAGCLGVSERGLAGQEGRAERWEPSAEQPFWVGGG